MYLYMYIVYCIFTRVAVLIFLSPLWLYVTSHCGYLFVVFVCYSFLHLLLAHEFSFTVHVHGVLHMYMYCICTVYVHVHLYSMYMNTVYCMRTCTVYVHVLYIYMYTVYCIHVCTWIYTCMFDILIMKDSVRLFVVHSLWFLVTIPFMDIYIHIPHRFVKEKDLCASFVRTKMILSSLSN